MPVWAYGAQFQTLIGTVGTILCPGSPLPPGPKFQTLIGTVGTRVLLETHPFWKEGFKPL